MLTLFRRTARSPKGSSAESTKKGERLLVIDKTILTCTLLACATAIGLAFKQRPSEQLGLDQLRRGRYHAARQTLQQAIKTDGPSCEAYLGLAKANNRMNLYQEGLTCADKALQYHPGEPAAWAERAVSHLGLADYGAALGDAEQALSFDSNNRRALSVQTQAETMLKNPPEDSPR
jgi:tetratricopeptide (TPR) repeat protein